MIGVNDQVLDLTPLPGLESPKEVVNKSGGATQFAQIAALQTTLIRSGALQAEIRNRAGGSTSVPGGDRSTSTTRRRARPSGAPCMPCTSGPGEKPLESLMTLVANHLKAYTHHTFFNIRDFGKNYLDTDFPVNLAGQIERDCGVYALTVAWDVFETVRQANPSREVTFSLRVMLDHVILVMEDKSTLQTYVVSNDSVTRQDPTMLPPPRRSLGDVTVDPFGEISTISNTRATSSPTRERR